MIFDLWYSANGLVVIVKGIEGWRNPFKNIVLKLANYAE